MAYHQIASSAAIKKHLYITLQPDSVCFRNFAVEFKHKQNSKPTKQQPFQSFGGFFFSRIAQPARQFTQFTVIYF